MRDLEYLQELYPRQAKKYRKRIEELLERFDSEGSVLYDEYPDRMTLYKMAQDIYAVLEQEEKREQAEAAAVAAAPADGGEVSTTGDRISAGAAMNTAVRTAAVSYTHLDVYKRQPMGFIRPCSPSWSVLPGSAIRICRAGITRARQ